jgi:hypothetical protein
MKLEQLMGQYFRLKQELSTAYATYPWHSARINRLANDLARTEQEIAVQRAHGESVPSELRNVA